MEMIPVIKKNLSDSITHNLRDYINNMDLEKNSKLPPENVISQNYGVSRVTVRRALDELEQEGLIIRIHGRGTFVNTQATHLKINFGTSEEFSQMIEKSGYKTRIELVSFHQEKADIEKADLLNIHQGKPLIVVEKNYFADRNLAINNIDYIPVSLFENIPDIEEWRINSNYVIMRKHAGVLVARERIHVESMSKKEVANYTGEANKYKCDSLLSLSGVLFDSSNSPVCYGLAFFDSQFLHFEMIRTQVAY